MRIVARIRWGFVYFWSTTQTWHVTHRLRIMKPVGPMKLEPASNNHPPHEHLFPSLGDAGGSKIISLVFTVILAPAIFLSFVQEVAGIHTANSAIE